MDYFFHTPSKNHGCFYPQEKGHFLPMDYFLHTSSKRWLFLSTGESAFYRWITSFITSWKRWLFLSTGERAFYHWISFITSSKGWLFLSTGERALDQWFYLHTSSNPEVNGRIRPENPESSANSVAAPYLVN
jgi:hypothetical protein